jgi:HSP20 family protein
MNIANQQQSESTVSSPPAQPPVQYLTPLADVDSTTEGYVISLEIPGVDKSGLEITVDDDRLTILGHRHLAESAGEVVHREIRANDFRRVYELGPDVDTTKISAHLEQGVLKLTLPKLEKVKPRQITVE